MRFRTSSLPHALSGARREIDTDRAGRISYYTAGPEQRSNLAPLLLIHSVNAAAGAHEVRPLFEHYRLHRPVYALDLPGYGYSDRAPRRYSPRIMTDAVRAMAGEIREKHGQQQIDALAVSLSCEFLARAALDSGDVFRSLALISPTGFNHRQPLKGAPGSDRGIPWLHRVLTLPLLGSALFHLLTMRRSVRFFLEKTWGSKQIDEQMFEYACLTARQPGASHAPLDFLSGYLFSGDIGRVYEELHQPVWMVHGVRGDFTDFRRKDDFQSRSNWRMRVYRSGALPYFELPEEFIRSYDAFLADVAAGADIRERVTRPV